MEEGRRMFQMFAAKMFENRLLDAYREKAALEAQERLIQEEEEAEKEKEERARLKKVKEKERKKAAKANENADALQAKRDAEEAMAKAQAQAEEDRKAEEAERLKRHANEGRQREAELKKRAAELKKEQEAREAKEAAEVAARVAAAEAAQAKVAKAQADLSAKQKREANAAGQQDSDSGQWESSSKGRWGRGRNPGQGQGQLRAEPEPFRAARDWDAERVWGRCGAHGSSWGGAEEPRPVPAAHGAPLETSGRSTGAARAAAASASAVAAAAAASGAAPEREHVEHSPCGRRPCDAGCEPPPEEWHLRPPIAAPPGFRRWCPAAAASREGPGACRQRFGSRHGQRDLPDAGPAPRRPARRQRPVASGGSRQRGVPGALRAAGRPCGLERLGGLRWHKRHLGRAPGLRARHRRRHRPGHLQRLAGPAGRELPVGGAPGYPPGEFTRRGRQGPGDGVAGERGHGSQCVLGSAPRGGHVQRPLAYSHGEDQLAPRPQHVLGLVAPGRPHAGLDGRRRAGRARPLGEP